MIAREKELVPEKQKQILILAEEEINGKKHNALYAVTNKKSELLISLNKIIDLYSHMLEIPRCEVIELIDIVNKVKSFVVYKNKQKKSPCGVALTQRANKNNLS